MTREREGSLCPGSLGQTLDSAPLSQSGPQVTPCRTLRCPIPGRPRRRAGHAGRVESAGQQGARPRGRVRGAGSPSPEEAWRRRRKWEPRRAPGWAAPVAERPRSALSAWLPYSASAARCPPPRPPPRPPGAREPTAESSCCRRWTRSSPWTRWSGARWPAAGTCWRAAPTSCGSRRAGPPTGRARCAGLLASGFGRSAAPGGRSQAARVPDSSSSQEGRGEAPERQSRPQALRPLWSAAVRLEWRHLVWSHTGWTRPWPVAGMSETAS